MVDASLRGASVGGGFGDFTDKIQEGLRVLTGTERKSFEGATYYK